MTADKVTIVVLNWKQAEATIACLESLREAALGGAAVLVVDNGSGDGSVERIRDHFPAQKILSLAENRGYAGGNNAGIRVALEQGAEGVLLLNNDTRVERDFLAPLLAALDSDLPTAAVSSAIMRMDRPEMLDVAYSLVDFSKCDAVRNIGVNALPGEGFDQRKMVEVAIGCSVLMTADALRTVGLFDETYFAYHEDVDWCLRARKAGYFILYEPYSRVLHRGSSSTRGMFISVERANTDLPELPNAEALQWNPVRTYLGSRNLVRIVRTYASTEERKEYRSACLYEIPLQFVSIVQGREGWLKLGRWGYKDALRQHFIDRHPFLRGSAMSVFKALFLILSAPFDLFVMLPMEIGQAYRSGRLGEFNEYLRGLRDGLLDRPIPFERLGLR